MTRDNVARFDETCEQHVSILRLFHEAGGKYSKDPQLYDILEIRDTNLVRLFEIFAAAVRKEFALECIDLVAFYGGPVDLAAAIRARTP